MDKTMTRIFSFDGDSFEVIFYYNQDFKKYFGDYPDFEEMPRFTSSGRPWITAMQGGCIHSSRIDSEFEKSLDCGSCIYFLKEQPGDLIGICSNENMKRK